VNYSQLTQGASRMKVTVAAVLFMPGGSHAHYPLSPKGDSQTTYVCRFISTFLYRERNVQLASCHLWSPRGCHLCRHTGDGDPHRGRFGVATDLPPVSSTGFPLGVFLFNPCVGDSSPPFRMVSSRQFLDKQFAGYIWVSAGLTKIHS